MTIEFSPVVAAQSRGDAGFFSVSSIDIEPSLGGRRYASTMASGYGVA